MHHLTAMEIMEEQRMESRALKIPTVAERCCRNIHRGLLGSGCGTEVECAHRNRDIMDLILATCWALGSW